MVHALAVMMLSLAPPECGTLETQGDIDRAAYEVTHAAVLADAEGRSPDPDRYRTRDGAPMSAKALNRLPRGWLAGAAPVDPDAIGIWSLNRSGLDEDVMLVRIGEGQTSLSRRVHLRCQSGRWSIIAVLRHPEGDDLDDLLSVD